MKRTAIFLSTLIFSQVIASQAFAMTTLCLTGPFSIMSQTVRTEVSWTSSESATYPNMIYISDFFTPRGPLRGVGGGESVSLNQPVGHYGWLIGPPELWDVGAQSYQYRIDFNPTTVVENPGNGSCQAHGLVAL